MLTAVVAEGTNVTIYDLTGQFARCLLLGAFIDHQCLIGGA
jgi:hypothetical protein